MVALTGWLPKGRSARRRLLLVAVAGVTLALAAGLALTGLRGSISYFYSPTEALSRARIGERIQIGGVVEPGSVRWLAPGRLCFRVTDARSAVTVTYHGSPPDLFREGQGIVANGSLVQPGLMVASLVLAKHDERYLPAPLVAALKARGEWRGTNETNTATLSRRNSAAR